MSPTITKAMRSMRIIAMPLTRPSLKPNPNPKASRILTYYHFQIVSPPPAAPTSNGEASKNSPLSRWIPEGGIVKWATGKAADGWAGFGKAKEGSWQLKVYQGGERLVDRMDFEELALKGIDPSLGPSITQPDLAGKENEELKERPKLTVPLIYPPSIVSGPESIAHLRSLLDYRTPRHRKGFFVWAIIAPFTAPFMIVPIIPNLPFFFCVWRSWSHYRAYRASQYLQTLLDSGAIVPEASKALDTVYKDYAPQPPSSQPHSPSSPSSPSPTPSPPPAHETNLEKEQPQPQHTLLLTRHAVPAILALFKLKEGAAADMYRAAEQARVRVRSGRGEL